MCLPELILSHEGVVTAMMFLPSASAPSVLRPSVPEAFGLDAQRASTFLKM
jgi:hypothetical protein